MLFLGLEEIVAEMWFFKFGFGVNGLTPLFLRSGNSRSASIPIQVKKRGPEVNHKQQAFLDEVSRVFRWIEQTYQQWHSARAGIWQRLCRFF